MRARTRALSCFLLVTRDDSSSAVLGGAGPHAPWHLPAGRSSRVYWSRSPEAIRSPLPPRRPAAWEPGQEVRRRSPPARILLRPGVGGAAERATGEAVPCPAGHSGGLDGRLMPRAPPCLRGACVRSE